MMVAHQAGDLEGFAAAVQDVLETRNGGFKPIARGLLSGAASPMGNDERDGWGILRWRRERDDDELGATERSQRLNVGLPARRINRRVSASDPKAKFTLTTTGRSQRLDHAQTSVDAPMHGLGVAPERATGAGRHIGERKLKSCLREATHPFVGRSQR